MQAATGNQNTEISNSDSDDDCYDQDDIQTLPMLVDVVVDENNNIIEIIRIQPLGKKEIADLYHQAKNDGTNEMSLSRTKNLVLSGCSEIISGSTNLVRAMWMGGMIGGEYLAPYVISFSKQAWKTFCKQSAVYYATCSEKYAQYMSEDNTELDQADDQEADNEESDEASAAAAA